MSGPRQIIFEKLNELGINYDIIEHPAVHTIEELDVLELSYRNKIVKNLFLRDDKKDIRGFIKGVFMPEQGFRYPFGNIK
ncbi:MAG: Ala-tRNA(Pro) deacylase [Neobacillus sp.]|nr:Ala-tRNA(Pro) deacylase [Neobacillus sp.]